MLNDYFNTIKINFIIGGDYNAKHQSWGCRVNNPRGIVLYNLANERHINVFDPPGSTYWPTTPNKNPVILDIFAAKILSHLHCSTVNILDLNSDHSSVLLTISATPLTRVDPPKLFTNQTDHKKFHDIINEKIDLKTKLKTTSDIYEAINNLTTFIQHAAWTSTKPDKTISLIKNNSNSNYFLLPEEIRSLITEKRRVRAAYQLSRLSSHKSVYNKLAKSLKKILAKHKAISLEKILYQLSAANGSF
jgi:hypothetical protein